MIVRQWYSYGLKRQLGSIVGVQLYTREFGTGKISSIIADQLWLEHTHTPVVHLLWGGDRSTSHTSPAILTVWLTRLGSNT